VPRIPNAAFVAVGLAEEPRALSCRSVDPRGYIKETIVDLAVEPTSFADGLEGISERARSASRHVLADEQLAEDVVQDVVIWAWKQSRLGKCVEETGRLVPAVARRTALNVRRHLVVQALAESSCAPADDAAGERASPWMEASSKELEEEVMHAVRELPVRQQQVFVLRDLDGMTPKDIGKRLHIAPSTVSTLHARACAGLRRMLAHFREAGIP
jgi:RNA polymerase sigma-70 factor, ECF subfamily